MKMNESTIWIGEEDLVRDPDFIAANNSEINPVSLESILMMKKRNGRKQPP